MLSHYFLFVTIIQSGLVFGGKNFRLGRSRGGNLGIPSGFYDGHLPVAQWFTQKLDHFSPSEIRTWKQRYFVNDSFYDYKNPGPVFLMIGGEGPADARWMVKGAWIDYAKKFNALCINLEHRYYGESHPTDDLSVKNLKYLSSHQALADLANFINAMNIKYELISDTKWIAFGGSYPGSLAAWLRMKYPHLVHASISSSGPLLAKLNFIEYFQVVVNALREKTGSDDCINQIKEAHQQIVKLIDESPEIIEAKFRVCESFDKASIDDMRNFYNSIADDFADLVQYNEDKRISDNTEYKNLTINSVCEILTEPGDFLAYEKLAIFNSIMLDKSKEKCMDYSYKNMIKELRNTEWNNAEGGRQWTYQTCTEFGFYQTSSGEIQVFGNNFTLNFFVQQCQDIFGKRYNKEFIEQAVENTNIAYGALNIDIDRIVYVHGSVDPWHALGITHTRGNNAPAIYIKGTAHCANMYPPDIEDSDALKKAREEIEDYLSLWIN